MNTYQYIQIQFEYLDSRYKYYLQPDVSLIMKEIYVQNFLYFQFWFSGEESQYIQSFFHDEGSNKKDPAAGAKAHFQLAKALAVLQIKASTFHSLHIAGRHDKVRRTQILREIKFGNFGVCHFDLSRGSKFSKYRKFSLSNVVLS